MKTSLLLLLLVSTAGAADKTPKCDGPNAWAASMAFAGMKNDGLVKNEDIDFDKTKVTRLASEPVKKGVHRQVHHVVYTKKSGGTVEAITVNNASNVECSEGEVEVFVISKKLAK